MKPGGVMTLITMVLFVSAQAVFAHPGHVHDSGPVHGFSWMDLALFLAASVALPVLASLVIHRRNRRR